MAEKGNFPTNPNLPVVTEQVAVSAIGDIGPEYFDDARITFEREQPSLAYLVDSYIQGQVQLPFFNDPALLARQAVALAYRMLRSQAESDRLNEAIGRSSPVE